MIQGITIAILVVAALSVLDCYLSVFKYLPSHLSQSSVTPTSHLDMSSSSVSPMLPLIPFIAVGHYTELNDRRKEFVIDSCYCHAEIDERRYIFFAKSKLKGITTVGRFEGAN